MSHNIVHLARVGHVYVLSVSVFQGTGTKIYSCGIDGLAGCPRRFAVPMMGMAGQNQRHSGLLCAPTLADVKHPDARRQARSISCLRHAVVCPPMYAQNSMS
jgi:hypothetical protein